MKPVVSIIIPCYQSAHTITAVLAGIQRQQSNHPCEIIVVNSSADGTENIIRTQFSCVKLIQLQHRTLASAARNIGARHANGDIFAFLDADCLVSDNWLNTAMDMIARDYCSFGGPIENANPVSTISWAGYVLEFSDFFSRKTPCVVAHIPSGNLFIKRDVFNLIGGFPEQFKYAQEDRYFSWLLQERTGLPSLFHPKLCVKHYQRTSFNEFLSHQHHIGRGGAEILKRTDLFGSELVQDKILMLFILPVLPFKKLLISLFRLIRWKPKTLVQYPLLIPLLTLGMLFWGLGFTSGVYAKTSNA